MKQKRGGMTPEHVDDRYVAARGVLLDALAALSAHRDAVVLAGAQAVYLRAGSAEIGVAPYTTDGDLALDPSLLQTAPELESLMRSAGFELAVQRSGHPEPGIWVREVRVDGQSIVVPVDLIVPEGVAPPGGSRGARLGPHGRVAARRATGLEAALVDNSEMTVASLDTGDAREFSVNVAGVPALLVAKAHKLHDRLESRRIGRLNDKDASDVYRLMRAESATAVASKFETLLASDVAGEVVADALVFLQEIFGRPSSQGIEMATRSLALAVPPDQVEILMTTYVATLADVLNS